MTTHEINLTVNGTDHELSVLSRTLLVHTLRDELEYTGMNIVNAIESAAEKMGDASGAD